MLMTIPTIPSSPSFRTHSFAVSHRVAPISCLSNRIFHEANALSSYPAKVQASKAKPSRSIVEIPHNKCGFLLIRRLAVSVSAGNDKAVSGDGGADENEREIRAESTIPERFRHLTEEAPEPPAKWPWLVALAFLIYAWKAVLLELTNWKNVAFAVVRFVGYLLETVLAVIFVILADPITSFLQFIVTGINTVRAFYSGIVRYAPVRELTMIIVLASLVLAIGEATVPDSISRQPYILTISGLVGYIAVRGYISEPLFWTILFILYGFSRLIKKRDDVTSALPIAAVLAAVGEPWVRILVTVSYTTLAIFNHSRRLSEGKGEIEVATAERRLPLPLLGAALAIGVHVAAKWAGYRHLTWMII